MDGKGPYLLHEKGLGTSLQKGFNLQRKLSCKCVHSLPNAGSQSAGHEGVCAGQRLGVGAGDTSRGRWVGDGAQEGATGGTEGSLGRGAGGR